MAPSLNPDKTNIIITAKNLPAVIAITGCLLLLIVCSQLFSGCASLDKAEPMTEPSLPAEAIAREIIDAEEALSQLRGSLFNKNRKAALLLRLAGLYAHPDNPDRNYPRAIDCLQQYTELEETVQAQCALSLLTRLAECASAGTACAELANQKKALEKQCRELSRENLQNKQIIEKLKALDIRLEKKRKSLD